MAGATIGLVLKEAGSSDAALAEQGQIMSEPKSNTANGDKTQPGLSARKLCSWHCKSAICSILIMERPFPQAAIRLELIQALVSTVLAYANPYITEARQTTTRPAPFFVMQN